MAGPAASVLLDRRLDDSERKFVSSLIHGLSLGSANESARAEGRFWISDGDPIGAAYRGPGRPFSTHIQAPPGSLDEPGVTEQIAAALGHIPATEILVVAYCNREEDHRLLGELTLHLAKRFGGFVDLGGPFCATQGYVTETLDVRTILSELPGQRFEVWYDIDAGSRASFDVVDTAFLEAWLRHPRFRMVK